MFSKFLNDETGATSIEYGLIASLIAVTIITGGTALGSNLAKTFNLVATKMKTS